MSVPLRSERSRGLAGMQRDKAPVEWPRSKGGDPTEESMLGSMLGRQSEALCMSHTGPSQWRRRKGKAGRQRTRENEKRGWERLNKQAAHVSMTAAR